MTSTDVNDFKEKTIMGSKLAIIMLIVFFASPLPAQELTGTLQQIKKIRSNQNRLPHGSTTHVIFGQRRQPDGLFY